MLIGTKKKNKGFIVGVSGASWADKSVKSVAAKLGSEIAKRNYVLLCGGMSGVMEAVCQGAYFVKGRKPIVGILPGETVRGANRYLDVALPSGLGYVRNTLIALASDVLVAVSGGAGTLSEIAYGWQYKKPIILFSNYGGWAEKLAGEKLDHRRGRVIRSVSSVEEAICEIDKLYRLKMSRLG